MSHSTTSRRGRTRTARRAILTGSPPVLVAWRMVRRMSSRAPDFFGRYRRVRRGGTAITSSRIMAASCASSAGESCAKSRSRSRSVIEATRRTAGRPSSLSAPSSGSAARSGPPSAASASSRPASPGGSSPAGAAWPSPVGSSACSRDSTTMLRCGAVTAGRGPAAGS